MVLKVVEASRSHQNSGQSHFLIEEARSNATDLENRSYQNLKWTRNIFSTYTFGSVLGFVSSIVVSPESRRICFGSHGYGARSEKHENDRFSSFPVMNFKGY